ncbi:hypothetical protein ACFXTI_014684 [Malus domestica]
MVYGDRNTAFFYNSIKKRANRNRIASICRSDGSITSVENEIKHETVGYFQSLLGSDFALPSFEVNLADLVTNPISTEVVTAIIREVSGDEFCKVCFSLKANKALGPDSFNAFFFQKAWPIIGDQIILAIQEFFNSTRLLRELNTTIITLVLKVPNPSSMGDFRPISCCNILYKIISKLWLIESKLFFLTLLVMLNLLLLEGGVLGIIFCLYMSFFEVII